MNFQVALHIFAIAHIACSYSLILNENDVAHILDRRGCMSSKCKNDQARPHSGKPVKSSDQSSTLDSNSKSIKSPKRSPPTTSQNQPLNKASGSKSEEDRRAAWLKKEKWVDGRDPFQGSPHGLTQIYTSEIQPDHGPPERKPAPKVPKQDRPRSAQSIRMTGGWGFK